MTFDYKKEYKEFYMPKGTPSIVTVPKINYIAVRGSGNPNDADGEYKQAIGLLYGIAFTIKMSKKEDHQIDGYFDYVVPPLEGFWWQGERRPGDAMLRTDRAGRRDGVSGIDYARKEDFKWISVIRLPDFITREDFDWAVRKATAKKKQDFSKVVFLKSVERGKCFIEYIPAECAWNPIEAPGYMYINCLWVSGSFKGHGYSSDLLSECIEDSKEKGKKGL